jgi:conjugative transfer pilus assembly protein TraH
MSMKMKISPLLAGMALAMAVSSTAHAELSDMQSFFDEVGVFGNSSSPSSFKGQTRNYVTGGSLQVRIPEKNYQLATFDPPRLSSSACGGIDAFSGSFSFLNSDQLVQMLQNIGNNAAGAVFQLALDSVSPKLGSVIKYFQDMANKVNALNVNSCEAAKGIVTATKNGALQDGFMNGMKEMGSTVMGMAPDWSAMKESFQSDPNQVKATADAVVAPSSPLSDDEKGWIQPGNLLWRALGKITSDGNGISEDEKRLIQAMVGTVVINQTTTAPITLEVEDLLPLMEDPLDTFMGVDATTQISVAVYTCNDIAQGTCNDVSNTGKTIQIDSLRKIIHTKIRATQEKVMSRSGGINAGDYEVINMSFLPIWTMMEADYRTGGVLSLLDSSEELIALAYTRGLLKRTLKAVRVALQAHKKSKNAGVTMAIKDLELRFEKITSQVDKSMAAKTEQQIAYQTAQTSLAQSVTRVKEQTAKQLFSINNRAPR